MRIFAFCLGLALLTAPAAADTMREASDHWRTASQPVDMPGDAQSRRHYERSWLAFSQAMLGRDLTAEERAHLTAEARNRFQRDPDAAREARVIQDRSIHAMLAADHPAARTAIQDRMRARLAFSLSEDERQASALWAMLGWQDPILATNARSETLLTADDARAAAALMAADPDAPSLPDLPEGMAQIQGVEGLMERFRAADADAARRISISNSYYEGLAAGWPQLDRAERAQALEAAVNGGELPQDLANRIAGPGGVPALLAVSRPVPGQDQRADAAQATADALGAQLDLTMDGRQAR